MLTSKPLRDVIAAFASSEPTPGGGSASALASSLGTSLLVMVASLPRTRNQSEDDRTALAFSAGALTGVQHQLTEAIDADSAAYGHVVTAYRQPKANDAEKGARQAAIERALRLATDVPLGVMRLSVDALKQAQAVAAHGHRAASSDVGVAPGAPPGRSRRSAPQRPRQPRRNLGPRIRRGCHRRVGAAGRSDVGVGAGRDCGDGIVARQSQFLNCIIPALADR